MGIYFAFYTFSFLILVLFQFPLYESMIHVYIVVGTFVLATLCYFISICRNPGYINPNKETSFLVSFYQIEFKFNLSYFIFQELLQLIDPIQLCPTCLIVKTPRSKHCNVCNRCVERMDHHCPWLNNCVGVVNHIYFMFFISLLTCNIIIILVFNAKIFYNFIMLNFIES